jgi:hypothetical protein
LLFLDSKQRGTKSIVGGKLQILSILNNCLNTRKGLLRQRGLFWDFVKDHVIPHIVGKSTRQMYNDLVLDSGKLCELWHRHFAHLHYRALPLLKNVVQGLPNFKEEQIKECNGCALEKHSKIVFPSNEQIR